MKDVVYLIWANGTDKYKIGVTSKARLEKRLKALQTGNSEELILVHTVITKFPTIVESTVHRDFKHLRQQGEWFTLSKEDVDGFICRCEKIIENIDTLAEMGNPFIIKQIKKVSK
jgi:hypothetical protein